MLKDNKVLIGKSEDKELSILLDKANRHGLITGASGSGKSTLGNCINGLIPYSLRLLRNNISNNISLNIKTLA